MPLWDIVDEIMQSMAEDGLSPFPGFFTLVTIAKIASYHGWEAKGSQDRYGLSSLSPSQMRALKRYLDENYERKHHDRQTYYSRNKRR